MKKHINFDKIVIKLVIMKNGAFHMFISSSLIDNNGSQRINDF